MPLSLLIISGNTPRAAMIAQALVDTCRDSEVLATALEGCDLIQALQRLEMSDLFWLTAEQIERLRPFYPKSHGRPRVDDWRVLSGIVFVNRNGLRWRNAPDAYAPHKTLYNRWKRWGEQGVFARMMEGGWRPRTPSRRQ